MRCACKEKNVGVCGCPKRRRIKRAHYSTREAAMPRSNFPRIRGPGQVYTPGYTPQVSTGYSSVVTGLASAFQPVLQAASNYLNQVTKSVEIRNKMAMAAPGAGSVNAGANSNTSSLGSINGNINQSAVIQQAPPPLTQNNNVTIPGAGPVQLLPTAANFATTAITTENTGTNEVLQGAQNDPFALQTQAQNEQDIASAAVSPTAIAIEQTPAKDIGQQVTSAEKPLSRSRLFQEDLPRGAAISTTSSNRPSAPTPINIASQDTGAPSDPTTQTRITRSRPGVYKINRGGIVGGKT